MNKNFEPPSTDAQRIEDIRKTISECLENARQACNDRKGTYEYDRLYDFLRAELYQAEKLRHLADAAILKEENPQQAELHFRKAIGKSGLDWIEKTKLLAAHKILTDLYDRSYPEAARIIIDIRPAVAKLANETQIVRLRKHFEYFRTNDKLNQIACEAWECIWEHAPRDGHPIDLATWLVCSIKVPG
jgi:hypothetical protein